jgi:hypothetical protein
MKTRLTNQHKQFIVMQLACFCSPSEIVYALESEFGVTVSRQQVAHYDPTVKQSKGKLKPEWIELFDQTRAAFIGDTSKIGISHLTYRLMVLDRMLRKAERQNNLWLALKILEQAAKECGGMYVSNRIASITQSAKARPVVVLEDWKRERAELAKAG